MSMGIDDNSAASEATACVAADIPFVGQASICIDLPCKQCGYNLRRMSLDRDCPECGRAIADSLSWWIRYGRNWRPRNPTELLFWLMWSFSVLLGAAILPSVLGYSRLTGAGFLLFGIVVCGIGLAALLAGAGNLLGCELPKHAKPRWTAWIWVPFVLNPAAVFVAVAVAGPTIDDSSPVTFVAFILFAMPVLIAARAIGACKIRESPRTQQLAKLAAFVGCMGIWVLTLIVFVVLAARVSGTNQSGAMTRAAMAVAGGCWIALVVLLTVTLLCLCAAARRHVEWRHPTQMI